MFVAAWKLEMCAVRRMGAKRYEEALECYAQMMERVKPTAHQWAMIALCYEWVGETEKAEKAARCALDADESSFDALRLLARVSIAQGHYAQAREYVQQALAAQGRPAKGRPRLLYRLAGFLGRLLERRQADEVAQAETLGAEFEDEQWKQWARDFLSGYERAFGENAHISPG